MPRTNAPVSQEEIVTFNCRLPRDLAIRLKLAAVMRNSSRNSVLTDLVRQHCPDIPPELAKARAVPQSV